jgi:hypothetical protein
MRTITNGHGPIDGVPTNPRALASDHRFPSLELLDALEERLGVEDAAKLWADARKARGLQAGEFELASALDLRSSRQIAQGRAA